MTNTINTTGMAADQKAADRQERITLLKASLNLTDIQASGLVDLAGFASRRAIQTLFADVPSFDFDIIEIEHFKYKGCCAEAKCTRGHALRHKYWVRLGVKTDRPQDYGVGITCLSHLKGMSQTEIRAVATIGTWTVSLAYNALVHLFGKAKDAAEQARASGGAVNTRTGLDVYETWKSSKRYTEFMAALAVVEASADKAATRRRYGKASIQASLAIARKCEESMLPCPTAHFKRIMAAHQRLVRTGGSRLRAAAPSVPASTVAGQAVGSVTGPASSSAVVTGTPAAMSVVPDRFVTPYNTGPDNAGRDHAGGDDTQADSPPTHVVEHRRYENIPVVQTDPPRDNSADLERAAHSGYRSNGQGLLFL